MRISNKEIQKRLRSVATKAQKARAAAIKAESEYAASNQSDVGTLPDTTSKSFLQRAAGIGSGAGRFLFDNSAKLLNTALEGGAKTADLTAALTGQVTGNKEARDKALNAGLKDKFIGDGQGVFGAGGFKNTKELTNISNADLAKTIVGGGLSTATEVLPFLYGAKEVQAIRGAKDLSTGARLTRAVGTNAALGAGGSVGMQLADTGNVDLKRTGLDTGLAGALGAIGFGAGRLVGAAGRKASQKASTSVSDGFGTPPGLDGVDATATKAANALDYVDNATKQQNALLLDAGQGRLQRELSTVNQQIDEILNNPNTKASDTSSLTALAGEPAANAKLTKAGAIDQRTSKGAGVFSETSGRTINTPRTDELRTLMRQRQALQNELDGALAIHPTESRLPTKANPELHKAVDAELQNVQRDAVVSGKNGATTQTSKVNTLVDYFRTPTQVLRKVGLHDVANTVERSFENYRKQRNISDTIIRDWARTLDTTDSQQKVFRFLNGDKTQKLTAAEANTAAEIRGFLNDYADKLGIPEDRRVTDYITHLFEQDIKGKTVDPTISQIFDNKATKELHNPFTQKRIGVGGYKEDLFSALDAYSKKADRSIYMNPALEATADASKNVDQRTAKYLLSLNHKMALKPDKVDQVLNDVVASVTGDRFGNAAGTRALKAWRNTIYRATLGLNVGSAVRNLTQGANTFAELGTRDTLAGYSQVMRAFGQAARQDKGNLPVTAFDELKAAGVLDDAIHRQDVTTSAIKTTLQKVDTGLWAFFDTAEKINRGAAYFGAKNKALRAGKTLEEAQNIGRNAVEKTQFKFNDIETPLALRNQVVKTLTQFQSFNIKQTEFLGGIAKGSLKGDKAEIAKAIRWIGANLVLAETFGQLIGMKWTDALPSFLSFRGITSPTAQLAGDVKNVAQGKNQYGSDTPRSDLAGKLGTDAFGLLVPGGTQIKKSAQGIEAINNGYSATDAGRVRFPISDPSPTEKVRAALFGQYSLPEAQKFYDSGGSNLSKSQSEKFLAAPPELRQQYYDFFQTQQGITKLKTQTNKQITQLIKDGEINKAQRIASQYNNTVEKKLQPFFEQYPNANPDILDSAQQLQIIITKARKAAARRAK